ncbi:G_PROTEIN_RECEP_F1_2 domain-containing protein [Meloidogyne graminicola]|uniref:G_PROTEIN_RECEP_F1_2 domain-containing protein n=1 Tax=Meloidogyne graminicola TaxID=189291 RepID=A0A8S9ZGD4_9BILA|nr:G_PROTEIN_RECEP_F1_2 domain-containing protein [Meloidogyne graminicola]
MTATILTPFEAKTTFTNLLFGIISNLLNIIVFLDVEMRQQLVNHFLLVLSISVLPVVVVETDSFFWNDFFPYIIRYSYPLALTAQTSGVYLTVLVSFHRFLGVCHPFKAKRWVSLAPVEFAIVASILFSFAINVPTWLELGVVPCLSSRFKQISRQIQLASFHNMNYILIKKCIAYTVLMYKHYVSVVECVKEATQQQDSQVMSEFHQFVNSSNFILAFILEILFVNYIYCENQGIPNLLKPSSELFKPKFSNSTRDRSITIMLLAIVSLFLLCNGLAFLNSIIESLMLFENDETSINILQLTNQSTSNLLLLNHNLSSIPPNNIHVEFEEDLSQKMIRWFERSVEISNVLITLNSSTSTLVYLIFSSKYRLIFRSLFGLSKRQKINRVALTTAMAARRVVELSLIPEEVESRSRRKNTKATTTDATITTPLNEGSFKSATYSIRERFDSQSSNYSTISSTMNRLSGGYKKTDCSTLSPNPHLSKQKPRKAVMYESQSTVQFTNLASVTISNTNHCDSNHHRLSHYTQKETPSVLYHSNGTKSLTNSESNLRLMDNNDDGIT